MSATMRRIDLIKPGGFAAGENLGVATVPAPRAGPGQVLLEIKASAINPVDWKMAERGFLIPDEMPAALGCDVAGVVVGPEGSRLTGKRVLGHVGCNKAHHATDRAAYAQRAVLDEDCVAELPPDMSFAQGASLPVGGLTGLWMLDELPSPPRGSWILVWGGSSSVGFNAIQLAARRGLKPIAVASGKHEAALREVGATAFVDYREDDVEAKAKEVIGSDGTLGGDIDCIAAADTLGACCRLVKDLGGGVVSAVSNHGGVVAPEGVSLRPVLLADMLDNDRARFAASLPLLVELKAQPIRSIRGGFEADTLEKAFQTNKDGVSGEKVVIEWTE
ncbi:hypothetical protein ACHAWF_012200 [Thalassiosira exigua]